MKKITAITSALMLVVTVSTASSAHKNVRYENGNTIVEFYDGEQFMQGYIMAN